MLTSTTLRFHLIEVSKLNSYAEYGDNKKLVSEISRDSYYDLLCIRRQILNYADRVWLIIRQ